MVAWEGTSRAQSTSIANLQFDSAGAALSLRLLSYTDGAPPPVLHVQQPTRGVVRHRAQLLAAGDDNDEQNGDEDDEDDEHGELLQVGDIVVAGRKEWELKKPTHVTRDVRTDPRTKPALNAGGRDTSTMAELFHLFLPEEWIEEILLRTNPKLSATSPETKKLTGGELKRFFGYMLSLTVHDTQSIEKMWSQNLDPHSSAAPSNMGRFGLSLNRFKKLRATITFGPEDELSFARDEWCFVRRLLTSFNQTMASAFTPGWLLGIDESMFAWRGQVGKGDPKKCPHCMWLSRKPEHLGVEVKYPG